MISLQERLVRVVICDYVTVEECPGVVEDVRAQYQRCGQPLYYVAIVPEDAPMPDTHARNAMTDGLRTIRDYCRYAAIVFCGSGMKATIKRTAFAGMLMMIMKGKWSVASSLEELVKKAKGDLSLVTQLQVASRLLAAKGHHA